jgi:hypothetical protein
VSVFFPEGEHDVIATTGREVWEELRGVIPQLQATLIEDGHDASDLTSSDLSQFLYESFLVSLGGDEMSDEDKQKLVYGIFLAVGWALWEQYLSPPPESIADQFNRVVNGSGESREKRDN